MNEKLKKEIKEYESAGLDVVVTSKGKLSYVSGGIQQDDKHCDSCPFLRFEPDPDPYDWFHDGDQKAVCTKMQATIRGCLERPSEMVNISKPLWCPNLGRELSEKEQRSAKERLEFDRERFQK